MPPTRPHPGSGWSRRSVLRLLAQSGLASAAGVAVTGCSASGREALLDVDPRRVRLDGEVLPGATPDVPTARERRRRSVRAGSLAALAAYQAAGFPTPLSGRHGGAADLEAATQVHRVHAAVLAGAAAGPAPAGTTAGPADGEVTTDPGAATGRRLLPPPAPDEGGPTLAPENRLAAVLTTGAQAALQAGREELAAGDAQPSLALLLARVAAARSAQAAGVSGAPAPAPAWPTTSADERVVAALQGLLAQEHRAHWSYPVVMAWSDGRRDDAGAARDDHAQRAERLEEVLRLLGAEPVLALPTYATDDAGTPVDGPTSAAALALRLEDAVTAAAAAVLAAAVEERSGRWLSPAVARLAEAERARWSWGGPPAPWPGAGPG